MVEVYMLWKMLKFEALRSDVTLRVWMVIVGLSACASHEVAFAFHEPGDRLCLREGKGMGVVGLALPHDRSD